MHSSERFFGAKIALGNRFVRGPSMSISQLVAAIDAVSRETRPEMRRSYMIAIKHGVKQIGDRLCAIEKRLDAVEQRRSEASVRA
jgi:hypothetical protein